MTLDQHQKIDTVIKQISVFSEWRFAGLLVVAYWVGENILSWSNEVLEWRIYLLSFFIVLLLFYMLSRNSNMKMNNYTYILIVPVLYLVAQNIILSISNILFLVGAIILSYGFNYVSDNELNKKQYFINSIYYFMLFDLSSKLVYWSKFDDFIWKKVPKISDYYKYADIIELVTPILVIGIYYITLLLIILSLNNDEKDIYDKKIWWVLPLMLFFIESFSTNGFFDKHGGGAMFHWQPYVGVIEMMQQDGLLLWDTPPHYGYLSMLTAYLIPVSDPWQKIYILNGVLRLLLGFIVFITIWNKRNLLWYVISIVLTLAVIYYLPGGGQTLPNSAQGPSIGAMRYIWAIILMFLIVKMRDYNLQRQVFVMLPIWLIGIFWSIGSAISVTAILGPFVLYFLFRDAQNRKYNNILLMLFPVIFITTILIIIGYYHTKIGQFPDFYSFIQLAVSSAQGFYAESFSDSLPYLLFVIILSFLASKMISENYKYIYFSLWVGLWSIYSRFIGQSNSVALMSFIGFSIYVIFLSLELLDKKSRIQTIYKFAPVLIIVLTMTYGNPHVVKHIYGTITNQDYMLSKTKHVEISDLHEILTLIIPGDIPIEYIEHGRYLNYLSKNQYINKKTNEFVQLNRKIWLPLRPAELYVGLTADRRVQYFNRWMKRHPSERGWIISSIDTYWHKKVSDALEIALKDYIIVQRVEYGVLKAILYSKI